MFSFCFTLQVDVPKKNKVRKLNEESSKMSNLNYKEKSIINKEIVHRTVAKYDVSSSDLLHDYVCAFF